MPTISHVTKIYVEPLMNIFFQVLNLFLALLLSSFSNDNVEPSTAEPEPNKLAEAISRFERFVQLWRKRFFFFLYQTVYLQEKR